MLPEMITGKSSTPAFVLIAGDEDISAKIQGRLISLVINRQSGL